MKTLVIGGTGNISRGIVAALQNRNHEVVLFNRGQHADPPPPDVRVIHGDRKNREDFEAKVSAENWDAVIDMISFNADDAASALRACQGRVGHFVHCSTVMTYGPPFSGINLPETAPLQGTSGYGLGKIAADNLLLEAHARDGFPVTIFKPSYTHGPGIPLHRQVGGDGSWIDRLRKENRSSRQAMDSTIFSSCHLATQELRLQIYWVNPTASAKYTTSFIHKRAHGTSGTVPQQTHSALL